MGVARGIEGGFDPCLQSSKHAQAQVGTPRATLGFMPFSQADLDRYDRAKTIRIETSKPGGPIHRTIIWAVVDGRDVFVRSWREASARWYREASANADVALHLGKLRLPARAIAATDPDSVARASAALERKYAGDPAARSMVRDDILDTTLRIEGA
jgi:hypothetical protein